MLSDEKYTNIAKEEFNVDIKKSNDPSSFEEIFGNSLLINKTNDIKKALEICADTNQPCNNCPYFEKCNYNDPADIQQDILELINYYESEIKRISDLVLETIESSNSRMEEACHLTTVKKNLEHLLSEAYNRIEELTELGEWLPQNEYNNTFGVDLIHHYACSNCGEIKYTNNDRYCSNCGTRMKERKDDYEEE